MLGIPRSSVPLPLQFDPVGVAHTPFSASDPIPRDGGPAWIDVYPSYLAAMQGLERSSHIWILAFLHNADRSVLRVAPKPRSVLSQLRGVFATRSPARPNPIGLSVARIVAIRDRQIVIDRLDFEDGTPVLDIKPYSPGWDLVPSATGPHIFQPERYTHDQLFRTFRQVAFNALGSPGPDLPSVRSLIDALVELSLDEQVDVHEPSIRFRLPHPDERVDVLLCCTGASFGNGRLALGAAQATVLEAEGPSRRWRWWLDESRHPNCINTPSLRPGEVTVCGLAHTVGSPLRRSTPA